MLALKIMDLVLAAAQEGREAAKGSGSLDDRAASSLLSTALALASTPTAGPKALELASSLLAVAASSKSPSIQLALAKNTMALRTACLNVGDTSLIASYNFPQGSHNLTLLSVLPLP